MRLAGPIQGGKNTKAVVKFTVKELNLKSRVIPVRQLITKSSRDKRLEKCQEIVNFMKHKCSKNSVILFSDEKIFTGFVALAALLPLVAAVPNTGSYASFSHHGQTYGYNSNGAHSNPIQYAAKPKEPAHKPQPYQPESAYKPYEPAYKPSEPAYKPHKPAYMPREPAYKPHHEPVYRPHPEPAYQPHPEPAYQPHPEPAYKPEPYHPAPAHHHQSAHHEPKYAYEKPKHNCTVEDVTEEVEVCTPAFKTECEDIELPIKTITDGEYCYDVARTVCTESIEEVANECFVALAALLPLVAAVPNTGSYASFSHHGQTYGYNSNGAHSNPIQYAPKPKEPAYKPQPYQPEPAYKPHEPAYKPHEPAYKPREPAYKPHHEPAYRPHHEPAYQPHPEPAYKPEPYHPAPAYHHQSAHHEPKYAYEKPKHNCTVEDVTEEAEVCTPAFKTECEDIELPIKTITDGEYCYDVARTVCTESIEEVANEVCSYTYEKKYEDTTAQTVEVTFKKESNVQMVTVCQPGHGHGYQSYGHQYCKEVAQETQYNVPVVAPVDVDVRVGYPEPIKACVNKPIALPQITCEVISEPKCVVQPQIEEATVTVQKCITALDEPTCQKVELTLPKQHCVEIVYGYAEETAEHYAQ
eukprot:snap_masked-scaffold72_size415059-processed-gene-1.9 protein:Tk08668 transcript:snap_masked-scaffold72_size415059-processed-gene-1.9-mRNA-1 annotation:"hypothetical protein"